MILKVFKVAHLGLFKDGIPKELPFTRATLVYGENGRGKSTIAAVLRSCGANDGSYLNSRKTLDGTGEPEAGFICEIGGKPVASTLKAATWTNPNPDILVFDSEFVDQNVYSGQEVRPEQRQALLDFALGEDCIALKGTIDSLTSQIEAATRRRSEAERTLSRVAPGTSVSALVGMDVSASAQSDLAAASKRIDAAKNVAMIAQRPTPDLIELPPFDVSTLTGLLLTTLEGLESNAEALIRQHVESHEVSRGLEGWLGQGINYVADEKCPFCAQSIVGLPLIDAYRAYFNRSYVELKERIDRSLDQIREVLSETRLQLITSKVSINTARIETWKDQLALVAPKFAVDEFASQFISLRQRALELAQRKRNSPLELVGTEEERKELWDLADRLAVLVEKYNHAVTAIYAELIMFKGQLASENMPTLEARRRELELQVVRQRSDVVAAVGDYTSAETERANLDAQKTTTRLRLDELMHHTLEQYQGRINATLSRFGAGFSVEQMKPNYVGRTGEARAEYGLQLRSKPLKLGSRTEPGPNFGTALSEGDKRTLAFAFFMAKVEADPSALQQKIIVMDDPVCSLDRNRRAQTAEVIVRLASVSNQVVVLSHDPYFVRELKQKFSKVKPTAIGCQVLGINRVQDNCSELSTCDIDELCASDYWRNYDTVGQYVEGRFRGKLSEAAKGVRPMLEGYYGRRFARVIPVGMMLGPIIEMIREAPSNSPLVNVKPSLELLTEINEYVKQFHHDNPTQPADAELRAYAEKALQLVYQGH